MKKHRPNKVYYDLETTGFDNKGDQIIEIAMVAVSPDRKILGTLEHKIKLRDGVIPSAGALLTNKLNPYSAEWEKEAITEHEMIKKVKAFGETYTTEAGKPILSAYNGAKFDGHFVERSSKRNFIPATNAFNESSRDPYKTAKRLIDANLIKTKEEYNPQYGTMQKSGKLLDVASALGVKYSGENAHRAMVDVLGLIEVDQKMEDIIQSAHSNNYIALPDMYEAGSVFKVVTDSKSGGNKTRHIYILHNDLEKEMIYAIDEDDINENKKFSASSVRKFAYGTIEKELDVDPVTVDNMKALVAAKKEIIGNYLGKKMSETASDDDEGLHEVAKSFESVKAVRERFMNAADLSAEIHKVRRELENSDVDHKSIRTLFVRVNDLHTAKGGRAFFRNSPTQWQPINLNVAGLTVTITPNPIGFYQVEISKVLPSGKPAVERKKVWSETELSKYLSSSCDLTQKEVDEYLNDIPPLVLKGAQKGKFEQVKNAKHPLSMINEWEEKTAALYSDEIPDDLKHGIAAIRKDIYRVYPEFGAPDDALFMGIESQDYRAFESDQTEAVKVVEYSGSIPLESQLAKAVTRGSVPAEQVSKMTKSGSVKCAVCGRPIKSEKALLYVMGDKCRARLMIYENGIESPQNASIEKWGRLTDKVANEGGIFLLKDQAGTIGVYSINNRVKIPGKIRVIDRKRLTDSLNHGFDLKESLDIATSDVEKRSIAGVSRIDVGPDAHKSKALQKLAEKESNRVIVNELPKAYGELFDEVKTIYSKAVERRHKGDEAGVDKLRALAREKVAKITDDLIKNNNYRALEIERTNMILNMNEHLFYDKQDLQKFYEIVENGKNIDSQYLKMKTSKDSILVFPNMKYKGFDIDKIGYGKPEHYHDDPFGPWDKEYGVSAKRLQTLHRKGKKVEIHTSSPRIIESMYQSYLPSTAKIYMYLRDAGNDEAIYSGNKGIEQAATILKERGHDVVLMKPKQKE